MLNLVTVKPKNPFEEALTEYLGKQSAPSEDWVQALREQGKARFAELGAPTRKQENWRFIDLGDLYKQPFTPATEQGAPEVSAELVDAHTYPETRNSRLVFVNGVYQSVLSNITGIPGNVQILELSQALHSHRSQLEGFLGRGTATESDPFVALNTAMLNQGVFISVPAGTQVETPLQLLFLTVADSAPVLASPRVLVSVEANAKLTIVQSDLSTSLQGTAVVSNGVGEFQLADSAELEWTVISAKGTHTYDFSAIYGTQQASSKLVLNNVNLGGRLTRNNLITDLQGEAGWCQFNSLAVVDGKSQVFDHTVIDHQVSGCSSEQTTKNILDGHAITEFDGTIVIRPGAQQTDSQQLNRNLLLSNDAKAYTRPQLRIDADDVKCAHGATVGQLNDEEIFYLTSRGLSQEMARSILTLGFAEELLDRISVAGVREHLDKLIRRQLEKQQPEGGLAPWAL